MLALRLGWRSFVRHKRRSFITALAVSLGLAMMLVFVGIADDGHARMAEMGIRLGAGHVLVQAKGYQEQQILDLLVAEPARVMAAARRVPGVAHVAPRVRTSGLLAAGERSTAVVVSGVDPAIEPLASDLAAPGRRVAGRYLRPRSEMQFAGEPADIYLGAELGRALDVGLGDRVVLTASPVGAARPAAAAFRVCGLVRTGVDELDGAWTEIPLDEAQKLLGLGERVSQVAVLLGDLEQSDAAAVALQKELGAQGELEVLSWKTALRELYEAIVLDELGLYLMMAIVFVIVAIGIFNTVLMSVTERTRELGVMMAIGTSRWLLGRIVMAEALVLGLVSSAAGLAIGLVLHAWVARHGIDIMAIAGAEQYEVAGVAFAGRIYSRLTALGVVKWTLVVMAVVLGSAAYPALRASRLRPVEAMRHV